VKIPSQQKTLRERIGVSAYEPRTFSTFAARRSALLRGFPTFSRVLGAPGVSGVLSDWVEQQAALFLKFLDDRAEVDGLIGKLAILGDFGLVQHLESVALEQFEPAPVFECHDLSVDLFDAVIIKITQIGFDQLTAHDDGLYFREDVKMKMPDGPRSSGYLAPRF